MARGAERRWSFPRVIQSSPEIQALLTHLPMPDVARVTRRA